MIREITSIDFRDVLAKNIFGKIFDTQTDFSAEIMPLMKQKATCYGTDLFFIDIGTPENLQLAEQFIAFQRESVMQ